MINPQPEYVDRNAGPDTGEFDTGNQLHRVVLRQQLTGREVAIERVVIGNGEHRHAGLARTLDQCGGRERAIGGGGVGVEVNQHNLYTGSSPKAGAVIMTAPMLAVGTPKIL